MNHLSFQILTDVSALRKWDMKKDIFSSEDEKRLLIWQLASEYRLLEDYCRHTVSRKRHKYDKSSQYAKP